MDARGISGINSVLIAGLSLLVGAIGLVAFAVSIEDPGLTAQPQENIEVTGANFSSD